MHSSTNRYLSGKGPALSFAPPHGEVCVVPRGGSAAATLQVLISRVVHTSEYCDHTVVFDQASETTRPFFLV